MFHTAGRARGRVLRHARARPVDRRAEPGRPERPQDRVPLHDAKASFAEGPQGCSTPAGAGQEADRRPRCRTSSELGSEGGAARRSAPRTRVAPTAASAAPPADHARLGRDRRDHELHQHVEPVGHGRRRPARQEGRRARADDQALGQGEPRPRLEGRDRLPRATPGSTTYLDQLRFNLVGYGCTTCIGNSGPLPPEISKAIHDDDLVAVGRALSGNRNFEGRINSDVRANYLASPPLVVAYALAGTMDIDLHERPARQRPAGQAGLPQGHLADPARGPGHDPASRSGPRCSTRSTARSSRATSAGTRSPVPAGRPLRVGRRVDLRQEPALLRRHARRAAAGRARSRARGCWRCWATASRPTTSRRPARSRSQSPAGRYLIEHGVDVADFNSYGSRRGNHEVMVRGTFANIRLRNKLAPGTEGGCHPPPARRRGDDDLRRLGALPATRASR